ncbi:carbon starvation protein A [bacterium]|nr:carbon starvation protein A [bacterium]
MITFLIGLLILFIGYIFYSRYTESQFGITDNETPAKLINDGVDFVPLSEKKNMLIHLLNIAGLGPILGAIQGILFGPVAFILIPLGCVFMGGVHDYFSGMLSVRNNGAQITELIKKYLGNFQYKFFIAVVAIMLLLLASVFVYTAGDLMAERFFAQTDFSLDNPVAVSIYIAIALYYILATLFPIDKIIGRFYPFFGALLLTGTGLVLIGFFTHGIHLENIDFGQLNQHPMKQHIIPMFFMTVSCGLLSGFHATQSTIISRTIESEKAGRHVFYGMMCLESLIAMIWAAGAMHVYSLNLVPETMVGTVNVINHIADVFVLPVLTFVVTIAVVVLPITSGDTALRGLRMILGEAFNLNQKEIKNRLMIIVPIAVLIISIILWAKTNDGSFTLVWRYFNFVNQLIAVPTFLYASVYLYKRGKNYLMTLIPGMFYIFITTFFILNSKIGFHLNYDLSKIMALVVVVVSLIAMYKYKLVKDDADR